MLELHKMIIVFRCFLDECFCKLEMLYFDRIDVLIELTARREGIIYHYRYFLQILDFNQKYVIGVKTY